MFPARGVPEIFTSAVELLEVFENALEVVWNPFRGEKNAWLCSITRDAKYRSVPEDLFLVI